MHKDCSADGSGEHPRARAHGVRLWDLEAGRAVSVTQMHGTWDARAKLDTPERAAQARRLLALAQGLAQPGDRQVICGDVNMEPGSEPLRILGGAGFTELVLAGALRARAAAFTPSRGALPMTCWWMTRARCAGSRWRAHRRSRIIARWC